jgi:FkbM family methyltransferase
MKLSRFLKSRSAQPPDRNYDIGKVTIRLSPDHPLPDYQEKHRLYDQFVLNIGKHNDIGWFVDIGANIGDTAAALAQTQGKRILCIEPTGPFLPFLEINAASISATRNEVVICPHPIGPKDARLELLIGAGTARSKLDAGGLSCLTLDEVVEKHCDRDPLLLIKCDIDGLDGMALLTGLQTIRSRQPALFFEFAPSDAQEAGFYSRLFDELAALDYEIAIFDNYGLPIAIKQSPEFAIPFADYMLAMNAGRSTRTFYYVDVFARPKASVMFERWINSYLEMAFR